MNNRGKRISILALLMCVLFLFCACSSPADGEYVPDGIVDWEMTEIGEADLHTEAQRAYLSGDLNAIGDYAKGTAELSRPEILTLTWSAAPCHEGVTASDYYVELATEKDFGDSLIYTAYEESLDVTNLYVAADYYWRVTAHLSDGTKSISPVSTFTTADGAPRNLYVDGITNVRDLGGWKTADGGRVRQGMIYRCGRLNKSETTTPVIEITEAGIRTMVDELGVRSEFDLRMVEANNHEVGGITSSPLGTDVNYYNVELDWNHGNYLLDNVESVKEFFRLAADESNYPFIFHCNIGTDRTGMFAFLINGLLGVSEEDLYRDYLFSNFGKINNFRTLENIENNYLKTVKEAEGDTLSEKIQNCLIGIGVLPEQLETIKMIMM